MGIDVNWIEMGHSRHLSGCQSLADFSGITVIGSPLHKSSGRLLSSYQKDSLDAFIDSERRWSMGDYMVVDSSAESCDTRIITAPGFSGQFYHAEGKEVFVSNSMSEIASIADAELNEHHVLNYLQNGTTRTPQCSTLFSGTSRLPPAAVCEITGTDVSTRSYLQRTPNDLSVEEALAEIGARLSKTVSGPLYVMFSGGVDSLLYLLLFDQVYDDVVPVTFGIESPTNGPAAHQLNEKLNLDVEFVDHEYPFIDTGVINHIESTMRDRLVNPRNPHFGFTSELVSDGVIVSGQNMDAAMTINMGTPGVHLSLPEAPLYKRWYRATRLALSNLRYTDFYINRTGSNSLFRHLTTVRQERKFVPGSGGFVLGMQSTGKPSVIQTDNLSEHLLDSVWRPDVKELLNFTPTDDNLESIELLNFYHYSRSCQETITGTGTPASVPVHLPVMWGPMQSALFGSGTPITDVLNPKRELYNLVEELTGSSYRELVTRDGLFRNRETSTRSPLVDRHEDKLTQNQSLVYEEATLDELLNQVESILEQVQVNPSSNRSINRLLNIELLLHATR
ncbi:hypothetical protein [Halostagnicola sp. A-GB9-2]|uniref:hypothetical protein n=1 Tax=Halostagnicola sp. A-GB9-2 TaxID=3048066 RepID=UPI0024C03F5E|nr:hypothetical protein [Halostagnicola sp. A-GB9-2]MDJ1431990.1 hypothetical protein [Halostagnicola sp. A-GB9-2]